MIFDSSTIYIGLLIVTLLILFYLVVCRDNQSIQLTNQTRKSQNEVDFLIIGAGICGSYLGSRLKIKYPHAKILLLEKNSHNGGRLLSLPLSGRLSVNHYAELGGMRYFPDIHPKLNQLIKDLKLEVFDFKVRDSEIPIAKKISKAVESELKEAGVTLRQVLRNEALYDKGFLNALLPFVSSTDLREYARQIGYNLLEDEYSFPVGADTFLNFSSMQQRQLKNGYQSLVMALISKYQLNVINNANVNWIDIPNKIAHATINGNDHIFKARNQLTVCLDFYSLEKLGLVSPEYLRKNFITYTAIKLYVKFRNPWWDHSMFGVKVVDNPLRQIWYYNDEWIQIYTDQEYARFWSVYLKNDINYFNWERNIQLSKQALELKQMLIILFNESLQNELIPFVTKPKKLTDNDIIETWGYFWPGAAFFWKPTDVHTVRSKFMKAHCLSGDYSNHQGWVEGALEVVDNYLSV